MEVEEEWKRQYAELAFKALSPLLTVDIQVTEQSLSAAFFSVFNRTLWSLSLNSHILNTVVLISFQQSNQLSSIIDF